MARDVFLLVPGFGGFDALGSVTYYCGVKRILRQVEERSEVFFFPNLPAAAVEKRAEVFHSWVELLIDQGKVGPSDRFHLIGHSTGGLDIRHWLVRLKKAGEGRLLEQVGSVQFLSVPHRGTWLAVLASRLGMQALARLAETWVQRGGVQGLRSAGKWGEALLRVRLGKRSRRTWLDAVVDAWKLGEELGPDWSDEDTERAFRRLSSWLHSMAHDAHALRDLQPSFCEQWAIDHDRVERGIYRFEEGHPLAVRSIVTRARARTDCVQPDAILFSLLRGASIPPLGRRAGEVQARVLLDAGRKVQLRQTDSDGLVPSLSQVWPEATASFVLEADHGDVIGHFGGSMPCRGGDSHGRGWGRSYDLLFSAEDFSYATFRAVWSSIGRWALER